MGIAWRGAMPLVAHVPDPSVVWEIPHHLASIPVSGVDLPGYPLQLRSALAEARAEHSQAQQRIEALADEKAAVEQRLHDVAQQHSALMQQWTDHSFKGRLRRWFGKPDPSA